MYKPLGYLTAAAAYLGPPLLLASDVLLVLFISTPGLLLQRVSFGVLIPAIAGVAVLAHDRAQWQVWGISARRSDRPSRAESRRSSAPARCCSRLRI